MTETNGRKRTGQLVLPVYIASDTRYIHHRVHHSFWADELKREVLPFPSAVSSFPPIFTSHSSESKLTWYFVHKAHLVREIESRRKRECESDRGGAGERGTGVERR